MTELTPNQIVALRLLRLYTNGRYDVYALAGGGQVRKRVAIMNALRAAKTIQVRAGVNALRLALYGLAQIDEATMTMAAAETAFQLWARKHGDPIEQVTIEQARETIAVLARADGEDGFAREVLAGAWDHRSDVAALVNGTFGQWVAA